MWVCKDHSKFNKETRPVVQHCVILALRRLRQEDPKFKACHGFLGSFSLSLAVRTLSQKISLIRKLLH